MTGENQASQADSHYFVPIEEKLLYPEIPSEEARTIFLDHSLGTPPELARHIFGQPQLPGCLYRNSSWVQADRQTPVDLEAASADAEMMVGNANTLAYFETALRLAYADNSIVLRHLMSRKAPYTEHHHFVFGFTGATAEREVGEQAEQGEPSPPDEQAVAAVVQLAKRAVDRVFNR